VGASNTAQQASIDLNQYGDTNLKSGGLDSATTRRGDSEDQPKSGTTASRDKAATGRGDGTTVEVDLEPLKSAVENNGKRLDSIVSLLGGTLSIEGTVDTPAVTDGLNALASDATDTRAVLAQVTSVVDVNGLPVDAKFTELQAEIELAKSDLTTQFTDLGQELTAQAEEAGLNAAQQEIAGLEALVTLQQDQLDDAIAEGSVSAEIVGALQDTITSLDGQISDAATRLDLTEEQVAAAQIEGREAAVTALAAQETAQGAAESIEEVKASLALAEATFASESVDVEEAKVAVDEAQADLAALRREFTELGSAEQVSRTDLEATIRKIEASEAEVSALKDEQKRQAAELAAAQVELKKAREDAARADVTARDAQNRARMT